MPLIPSLRRALARLFDRPEADRSAPATSHRPPTASPVTASPWRLLTVGDHVVFASSPKELERALVLLMDGADEPLRRVCGRALQEIRAQVEEAAA